MKKLSHLLMLTLALAGNLAFAESVEEAPLGEAVERHLSDDVALTKWVQNPDELDTELGDTLETRETLEDALETVKLSGLVPSIHFESGVAKIPDSTVASLGDILERMRDRINVRLHLIGHADNDVRWQALIAIGAWVEQQ